MPVPKGVRVGGRQKGTPNKRTAAIKRAAVETIERISDAIEGAFDGDAHALLVSVYKDPLKEWPLRVDAAKAAIRYEKPALGATTVQATVQTDLVTELNITLVRPGGNPAS